MAGSPKATPGKTSRPPVDAKRYNFNEEFKGLTVIHKVATSHPGMRTNGAPQTARAKTENYPIGEMRRTNLEGMVSEGEKLNIRTRNLQKPRGRLLTLLGPPADLRRQSINEVFGGLTIAKPQTSHPGMRTGGAQTARIQTKHYPIGEMNRTNIEGMLPEGVETEYQPKAPPGNENSRQLHGMTSVSGNRLATQISFPHIPSGREPPDKTKPMSFAPAKAITVLVKPEDAGMAAKQPGFSKMTKQEQVKQNKWANNVLKRFAPCPQGWDFKRVEGGYQCHGKFHFQSDELIAETKGGIWMVPNQAKGDFATRWGPYYAEETNPKYFFYSGPDPIPEGAPVVLDKGSEHYASYRARLLKGREQT